MEWILVSPDALIRGTVLLLVGWLAARLVRRGLLLATEGRLTPHNQALLVRVVYWLILIMFAVTAAYELGFDLTVILGAAGIVSVALGFASQTSASNLISGLFLLAEKPFGVGDVIKIDDVTGEVLSIDMLSVKLRTFDNLFVRVPNESLMKSRVTTFTRFPIRRYDLQIGIAYGEDIRRTRDVLLSVAKEFHLCLDDPAPVIILQGFGDSSINIQFSVWAARAHYLDVRNGIHERVKEAFDNAGIEIPFPHLSLYAGTHTKPVPVEVQTRQGQE